MKDTIKMRDTRSKILQLINKRTCGSGLDDSKKSIKDEND